MFLLNCLTFIVDLPYLCIAYPTKMQQTLSDISRHKFAEVSLAAIDARAIIGVMAAIEAFRHRMTKLNPQSYSLTFELLVLCFYLPAIACLANKAEFCILHVKDGSKIVVIVAAFVVVPCSRSVSMQPRSRSVTRSLSDAKDEFCLSK